MNHALQAVTYLKKRLMDLLQMKDHGEVKSFLGVEFVKTDKDICLRQNASISIVLKICGMFNASPVDTSLVRDGPNSQNEIVPFTESGMNMYQRAIGSLLFISTRNRPDTSTAVSVMAKKSKAPNLHDRTKVKRIFRYLKGTIEFGINCNPI